MCLAVAIAASMAEEHGTQEKIPEPRADEPGKQYSGVAWIEDVDTTRVPENGGVERENVGGGTGVVGTRSAEAYYRQNSGATVGADGEDDHATAPEASGSGNGMEVDGVADRDVADARGFVLLEADEAAEMEEDSASISTVSSIATSLASSPLEGGEAVGSEGCDVNNSAGGRVRSRVRKERASPMDVGGGRRARRGGRVG